MIMEKKEGKKIIVEGEELELDKVKSMEFTMDLKIPKEDFDRLLKAMSFMSDKSSGGKRCGKK